MSTKSRITVIDIMKGLAMVFVIMDHCGFALHPVIDHIEVAIFYAISGYLFGGNVSFAAFIKRKAYTLLLPYLIFSLLYVIPYMLMGVSSGILGHIYYLIALPANYPLWFIKALFWALVGYYWVLRIVSESPVWVEAAINAAVAVAVTALVPLVTFGDKVYATGLVQGIEALPLIGFGHVAARLTKTYPYSHHKQWYISITALAVAVAYITSIDSIGLNKGNIGEHQWLYYLSSVSCCIVYAAVCHCIIWMSPLRYIGSHSVTFLGFQAIAIFIFSELIVMPTWLLPIAALLLCIPIAEIWHRLMHRN